MINRKGNTVHISSSEKTAVDKILKQSVGRLLTDEEKNKVLFRLGLTNKDGIVLTKKQKRKKENRNAEKS